jgi:hypothetical protein
MHQKILYLHTFATNIQQQQQQKNAKVFLNLVKVNEKKTLHQNKKNRRKKKIKSNRQ